MTTKKNWHVKPSENRCLTKTKANQGQKSNFHNCHYALQQI